MANKVKRTVKREVKMYRRQKDGTYVEVEMEHVEKERGESEESKNMRELAKYGRIEQQFNVEGIFVEIWLVPAGTYIVREQSMTIPETHILVTKKWARNMNPYLRYSKS